MLLQQDINNLQKSFPAGIHKCTVLEKKSDPLRMQNKSSLKICTAMMGEALLSTSVPRQKILLAYCRYAKKEFLINITLELCWIAMGKTEIFSK